MKSSDENKQWSEEAVDELLTTFFQAEMPAQLRSSVVPPGLVRTPTVTSRSPVAVSSNARGKTAAVVCCAAALILVVGLAVRFSGNATPSGEPTDSNIVGAPGENDDEPINVNAREIDDFNAPEQDIEILDNDDKKSKKK